MLEQAKVLTLLLKRADFVTIFAKAKKDQKGTIVLVSKYHRLTKGQVVLGSPVLVRTASQVADVTGWQISQVDKCPRLAKSWIGKCH